MYDVCLIDDDEILLRTLARRLTQQDLKVATLQGPVTEQQLLQITAHCYLIDLRIAEQSGLSLITPLRQAYPACRIIMLTGFASIATAVQAVKLGADDYLTKPVDFSALLQSLSAAPENSNAAQATPDTTLLSPEQLEWEHIQRTLEQFDGNVSHTARALGMHRRTLQRKLLKRRPEKRIEEI
ncbi:response regulator transcription factor [Alishewanella longhuensis]